MNNSNTQERLALVNRLKSYCREKGQTEARAQEVLPDNYRMYFGRNNLTGLRHSPLKTLLRIVQKEQGDEEKLLNEGPLYLDEVAAIGNDYWLGLKSLFIYLCTVFSIGFLVLAIYTLKILPSQKEFHHNSGQKIPEFSQMIFDIVPEINLTMGLVFSMFIVVIIMSQRLKARMLSGEAFKKELFYIPILRKIATNFNYFAHLKYTQLFIICGLDFDTALNRSSELTHLEHKAFKAFACGKDGLVAAKELNSLIEELDAQVLTYRNCFGSNFSELRDKLTIFVQVFVGLFFGSLLIAMYLPIFQIGKSI